MCRQPRLHHGGSWVWVDGRYAVRDGRLILHQLVGVLTVALLAPPEGLTLRVLIRERDRAYPASIRIVRIDAVADSGEMMLG